VEPRCKKSSTDTAEPNRAKDRSERAEPSCKKSRTDTVDPIRAKLLIDSEDPRRT